MNAWAERGVGERRRFQGIDNRTERRDTQTKDAKKREKSNAAAQFPLTTDPGLLVNLVRIQAPG
jgi:hypothetical protein